MTLEVDQETVALLGHWKLPTLKEFTVGVGVFWLTKTLQESVDPALLTMTVLYPEVVKVPL